MFILSVAHWKLLCFVEHFSQSTFEPYDKSHEEYNIQPKHQVLVVVVRNTHTWCEPPVRGRATGAAPPTAGGGAEPGPGFSASPRSGLRAAACLASRPSTQPAAADTEKCFAQQKLDRAGAARPARPASTAVPVQQR